MSRVCARSSGGGAQVGGEATRRAAQLGRLQDGDRAAEDQRVRRDVAPAAGAGGEDTRADRLVLDQSGRRIDHLARPLCRQVQPEPSLARIQRGSDRLVDQRSGVRSGHTPKPRAGRPRTAVDTVSRMTDDATTTVDWNHELLDQLEWHWQRQLRPRLSGLTDAEYFWAPGAGPVWTVHAVGAGGSDHGTGDFRCDFDYPEPVPPPVTTIGWRLAHLIVGVFGMRAAAHFDGPPMNYDSFAYAGTAGTALDQLDEAYAAWTAGVRSLGVAGLAEPSGPAEGPFADYPKATLVLHINREAIHHGAEVALLRDLYAARHTP